jgi:D-amino-acid dehydrogenase
MRQTKSVIICGGGVLGLSSAYYLAREGWQVTVVERNAEGADSCAQGSAGYISPSHVEPISAPGMVWKGLKWMLSSRSPFYIKPRLDSDLIRWGWLFARHCTEAHRRRSAPILRDLCLESRRRVVELSEITGDAFELKTAGLMNACQTQETLDKYTHGLAALCNEVGVEAKVLNAQEVAVMEPGAKVNVAGAIYFPIDAHISPRLLVPALTALLKEMGVTFLWNTSVYGWRAEGGRIGGVSTTAGDLVADEYVLTGGSWSPAMVQGLGIRLPMQAGKGYSLTMDRPRFHLKMPMIFTERRVAMTPMGEKLRFGGTMEITGHDDRIRPERVEQIIAGAKAFMPELTDADFAGIKPWFGYRPVSPDGLPYIGRLGRYANLSTASGHAMLGLTLAPISGQLIAEVLGGRKPSVDLRMLNPNRFA